MRLFSLFCAYLLSGCVSKSSEVWQGPPIVHMTCPGTKGVAIIPTMHSYGGPIPPNVQAEVKKADVIFLEYDFTDVRARMFKAYGELKRPLPKLAPLYQGWLTQLDEQDLARVERQLARGSMKLSEIRAMDPETAYFTIVKLAAKDAKPNTGEPDFGEETYDWHVQQFAERGGIETVGLETMEEFLGGYIDEQESMLTNRIGTLRSLLRNNEASVKLNLVQDDKSYTALTLDAIEQYRTYAELLKSTSKREARWVERLGAEMPGKHVVVAVGAAHVSPTRGLPAKLVSEMNCQ